MFFFQRMYQQMKRNEEYRFLNMTVIAKIIGQKWNDLSEAEKLPFVKLMKEDKKRYLEEVEVYEIKNQIAEKTARLESEQKSLIDSSEDEV